MSAGAARNAADKALPKSLLHTVAEALENDPGRDAFVFNGTRITYGDMAMRSLALMNCLKGHGVKPGDFVAVLVTPRPEGVISLLAVWLLGATWVGINTRYKLGEQRDILRDCGARILISETQADGRALTADLKEHEAEGLTILTIGAELWDGDFPTPDHDIVPAAAWNSALDNLSLCHPAVVIYTSGSTGRPKGALTTHAGLAFRAATMVEDRFDGIRIRLLLDLPLNHIGALASGVGLALASGGLLVMAKKFDPGQTLKAIEAYHLNVLIGVPAMMARIAEDPDFGTTDVSSLKFMCWGAGPISERVLDRFLETTDARMSQQYGMTETNGFIVYTPPTRNRDILLTTTGKPDKRLQLRIADENGQPLPAGEEGEVQVKMPHPFAGYLNNPDATAQTFTKDDFLRTGDLALLRPDGYLVFCGRAKEMYKSGGFNVYPREVEIALEAHPDIRAAAVLAREDDIWGQVGVAFVEGGAGLDASAVTAWCKESLADFKVPKTVKVVEALPRTPVGKVDRVTLSKQLNPIKPGNGTPDLKE